MLRWLHCLFVSTVSSGCGLNDLRHDPAGQGIEAVRPIRDAIRARVEALLDDLLGAGWEVGPSGSGPTTQA